MKRSKHFLFLIYFISISLCIVFIEEARRRGDGDGVVGLRDRSHLYFVPTQKKNE
jgi:hypothetical protein